MSTITYRTRTLAAAALLLLMGGLALSACSSAGSDDSSDAKRDSETQEVTSAGDDDPFSMKVGDCFSKQTGTQITSVPMVPCSEAHDNEVFHAFDIPDDSYPGKDSVVEQSEDGCMAEFEPFTGISYEESALNFTYMYPTEESWKAGDREVLCIIYEDDVQTTGSLAGTAR